MGTIKDNWIASQELSEGDLIRMQQREAADALGELSDHIDEIIWHSRFFGSPLTLEQVDKLAEEIKRVRKIIL